MFVRIGNTPRDYAWGSTTAISELLGTPASGKPEAELWLGAHAGSPSRVLSPEQAGGADDLAAWIAADPTAALGQGHERLPFLLKVLAAAGPLSLQAHPSSERAAAGFAAENAAGVPLDSPSRNYKDPFHKPELIYALSDRFEALCGFREVGESVALLDRLIADADAGAGAGAGAATRAGAGAAGVAAGAAALAAFRVRVSRGVASVDAAREMLRETVGWLLGGGGDVEPLVDAVVAASARLVAGGGGGGGSHDRELRTVGALAGAYPGDAGIVLSLLLNRVSLRHGEALYLPAGNIHAYLEGLGVELMAASDNVLRGGLTPKHIDVPELLAVLDFTPLPVPYIAAVHVAPGADEFRPDVPDFALWHIEVGADVEAGKDGAGAGGGADGAGASGGWHGGGAPRAGGAADGVDDADAGGAGDAADAWDGADAALTNGASDAGFVASTSSAGIPLAEVMAGSPDLLVVPAPVEPDAPPATIPLRGAAIALCVDGAVELDGATGLCVLRRGESVYVTPQEASITVSGAGAVFFATANA